jgi:hypothetical protein
MLMMSSRMDGMTPAYGNSTKWQRAAAGDIGRRWGGWLVLLLLGMTACAPVRSGDGAGGWSGPTKPAILSTSAWHFEDQPATQVRSAHYVIYTTIDDPSLIDRLGQTLEGALGQYRRLAPGVALSGPPLACYFFKDRAQWARFTRQTTGEDAQIYLQIIRGGYSVGDRFVAYEVGTASTVSVAAHEGWHQFAARHFKGRLPPFLEEGIACLFESVRWKEHQPRWNLSSNPARRDQLRNALATGTLWPLRKLIMLHAGAIVDQPRSKIEAFYAQSWAFARFLWEAEGGAYRPALQHLLADAAAGTVYDPTHSLNRRTGLWNPRGVGPLLEHYLGTDLTTIERAYQKFLHHITDERPEAAW